MVISGRLEYGDERYDIGIVRRNEFVRVVILVEVFELVDDDIDCTSSWFCVQLLMKAGGEMERVLPSCLAVHSSGIICVTEVVPETFHVVLGFG